MTHTVSLNPARAGLAVSPGHYAPDEFAPLLECSYGSYIYTQNPSNVGMPLNSPACHNPVERPEDRFHCELCGGNYCSVHAALTAHDCERVMDEKGEE